MTFVGEGFPHGSKQFMLGSSEDMRKRGSPQTARQVCRGWKVEQPLPEAVRESGESGLREGPGTEGT